MGIMQKALETYQNFSSLAGEVPEEGHAALATVSYTVRNADVEIKLNESSDFDSARLLEQNEKKTVIPVTEASSGRTSNAEPHPIFDQLVYLAQDINGEKHKAYIDQLSAWATSSFGTKQVSIVLSYIQGGTIVEDLKKSNVIKPDKNGKYNVSKYQKLFIRFKIIKSNGDVEALWESKEMMRSFREWYAHIRSNDKKELCYVCGKMMVPALQHAKGIVSTPGCANAKIISDNDDRGFTYRGRFLSREQVLSIGYETSQMAHNALQWLVQEQGDEFGGREIVCWCPGGVKIPKPRLPLLPSNGKQFNKPSDYRKELHEIISGQKSSLKIDDTAVIVAFDAATVGRLAIVYYNELNANDYLDRICSWDSKCCWLNESHEIRSPWLTAIPQYAYGALRKEGGKNKIVAPDAVFKNVTQRLISIRILDGKVPNDIAKALVNKVTYSACYPKDVWDKMVFVACSVINKKINDEIKENAMDWTLDKKDRSFQYGRLLAVMEKVEMDYYRGKGTDRQPMAKKQLVRYYQHPLRTFEEINRHLTVAYLPRVKPGCRIRYEKTRDEILEILSGFTEQELNSKLSETYLLGYTLQKNEFWEKSVKSKEENNENDKNVKENN